MAWVYTFGFTTYRHHLAPIGLPLGILNIILALGIFTLNQIALKLSIFLIGVLSIISFGIFFFIFDLVYLFIAIFGISFIYSSLYYLDLE